MDFERREKKGVQIGRSAIWLPALGRMFALTRLAVANFLILRSFQRKEGLGGTIVFWSYLSPIRRSGELFLSIPLRLRTPSSETRRLKILLRRTRALCARSRPRHHRLTAPAAERLQAAMVRGVFRRTLGLRLTRDESRILASYPSPAEALRDLLEYCGYGESNPPSQPLFLHLPAFLVWCDLGRETFEGRSRMLDLLAADPPSARWWRSRSCRRFLQRMALRIRWSGGDLRQRHGQSVDRRRLHAKLRRTAKRRAVHAALSAQTAVADLLANELLFRALEVLAELPVSSKSRGRNDERRLRSFEQTIRRLEGNLHSATTVI